MWSCGPKVFCMAHTGAGDYFMSWEIMSCWVSDHSLQSQAMSYPWLSWKQWMLQIRSRPWWWMVCTCTGSPPALLVTCVICHGGWSWSGSHKKWLFQKSSQTKQKIPPNLAVCVDDDVFHLHSCWWSRSWPFFGVMVRLCPAHLLWETNCDQPPWQITHVTNDAGGLPVVWDTDSFSVVFDVIFADSAAFDTKGRLCQTLCQCQVTGTEKLLCCYHLLLQLRWCHLANCAVWCPRPLKRALFSSVSSRLLTWCKAAGWWRGMVQPSPIPTLSCLGYNIYCEMGMFCRSQQSILLRSDDHIQYNDHVSYFIMSLWHATNTVTKSDCDTWYELVVYSFLMFLLTPQAACKILAPMARCMYTCVLGHTKISGKLGWNQYHKGTWG